VFDTCIVRKILIHHWVKVRLKWYDCVLVCHCYLMTLT